MAKNPNAVAALLATQAGVAGEELLSRYLSVHLGPFWGKEAMAAMVVTVLYIGRDGIKGALVKTGQIARSIWNPNQTPPSPPAS